jgi:hypothetical protein
MEIEGPEMKYELLNFYMKIAVFELKCDQIESYKHTFHKVVLDSFMKLYGDDTPTIYYEIFGRRNIHRNLMMKNLPESSVAFSAFCDLFVPNEGVAYPTIVIDNFEYDDEVGIYYPIIRVVSMFSVGTTLKPAKREK